MLDRYGQRTRHSRLVLLLKRAPVVRQSCPDSAGSRRSRYGAQPQMWLYQALFGPIYDIFEGTAEIQQLVIARAISGMHIK
jgi:hypothetical protein